MDTPEKLQSAMQEKMNEAECKTSHSTATAVMDLFLRIQTQLELSITQMIEKKQAINNDLLKYKNIIPCGISDKGVINLKEIKDQDYKNLDKIIIDTFSKNLEI